MHNSSPRPKFGIGQRVFIGDKKVTVTGYERTAGTWYICFSDGNRLSTRVAEKIYEVTN